MPVEEQPVEEQAQAGSPPETPAPAADPEPLTLTQEQLAAMIADAVKAAVSPPAAPAADAPAAPTAPPGPPVGRPALAVSGAGNAQMPQPERPKWDFEDPAHFNAMSQAERMEHQGEITAAINKAIEGYPNAYSFFRELIGKSI